jgi:hypothetical protein
MDANHTKGEISREEEFLLKMEDGLLSYPEFKYALHKGLLTYKIDSDRAEFIVATGFPTRNAVVLLGGLTYIGIISFIPVVFGYGWFAGICVLVVSFSLSRLRKIVIVKELQQAVLDDSEVFKVLRDRKIIQFQGIKKSI